MGGFDPLYKKGGKIIQLHGWADSLVSALGGSSQFYETVMKQMGVERTKSFWKLYLVPGASHCGGGIGCYPTTGFQALVNWVEGDAEPQELVGSRAANVDKNPWYPYWTDPRSRPICPYPEVARYRGSGSIEVAASFMCVPPIDVRIEPDTLNLKSKGEFAAFISVPEGYDLKEWNIGNVTCEGAPMIKGVLSGNTYTAKFNKQDLVNAVAAGDAVTLTVNGTFTYNSNTAQIQASDTIRVIK
jgi:hypothetical protein